ncbi:MAG: PEP-CTERM sorting domain-containing protein [Isosphaeraceae bacterium]|nr:PEP-CTERM sorting domain-containing protein [Isosphaeraceae bacterium]
MTVRLRFSSLAGLVLSIALTSLSASPSRADVVVTSGSFAGPNPFKADPTLVSSYRSSIAAIGAGILESRTNFGIPELTILDVEPYEVGNSTYHVSIFGGLLAGDVVRTLDILQSRFSASDPWETFSTQNQWVQIGAYVHSPTQTVSNHRDFIEDLGGGAFQFVKGTGLFWYVFPDDDPLGWELRVLRSYEVIRGAALVNPRTNGRGLTIGDGVVGGTSELVGEFTGLAVAVPEPSTMALAAVGGLAMLVGRRVASRRGSMR